MIDDYFKSKAKEINNKITALRVNKGWKVTQVEIEEIIYLGLKEVAKDQRYASIELIRNNTDLIDVNNNVSNFVIGVIHNS
jgi:predicted DNA-binding ribbon-helix-helix protein